mgnify:CR=1 FL=1
MPGARLLVLELRHFEPEGRLADAGMFGVGARHPGVDLDRVDRRQGDRRGQPLGFDAGAADQLIERDALDLQIVGGRNFLRRGQVEARLRAMSLSEGVIRGLMGANIAERLAAPLSLLEGGD